MNGGRWQVPSHTPPNLGHSPLTVIGLFVVLLEVALGVGLHGLDPSIQGQMVNFMMLVGGTTVVGFFAVLIWAPHHFYGPTDFRDERLYVTPQQRVQHAEALATVINEKIEAMSIYRFSRLSDGAKHLFLLAYQHLFWQDPAEEPAQVWAAAQKGKNALTDTQARAARAELPD